MADVFVYNSHQRVYSTGGYYVQNNSYVESFSNLYLFFAVAPAASARERVCDAMRQAEHSKVNPMPLQNPFGEEIFTFPPLCPLPLAKGGACNLTQIGWLETTSYIIFSACKLRSKGKGDRTGANPDRFQVPPVGEIDED